MEIYVYFLISVISVHALYQTTYILLDLYYTNTDENKNECKLIKNKLKTTKNLNTMLLNHTRNLQLVYVPWSLLNKVTKQILKEELHSCIYILTQRNNLTDQCSVLKLFYLYS